MDFLLALAGKDFVLTLTDTTVARSIVVMKHDQRKSRALTPHSMLLFSGEPGDVDSFVDYAERNVRFYALRTGLELSTDALAAFIRRNKADSLRSRSPLNVNMILAGVCPKTSTPSVHWIDYLAASAKVPFAVQGYGHLFTLSMLDRHYTPDMSQEEAIDLAKMCATEMKKRFLAQFSGWKCSIIDRNGEKQVEFSV